jgi:hypothetical protein
MKKVAKIKRRFDLDHYRSYNCHVKYFNLFYIKRHSIKMMVWMTHKDVFGYVNSGKTWQDVEKEVFKWRGLYHIVHDDTKDEF